jgi:hypothetical protein
MILGVWGISLGLLSGLFGLGIIAGLWFLLGEHAASFHFLSGTAAILAVAVAAVTSGIVCWLSGIAAPRSGVISADARKGL